MGGGSAVVRESWSGDFPSQSLGLPGYEMGGRAGRWQRFCLVSSSEGLGCGTTRSSISDVAAQEDEEAMPQRPGSGPHPQGVGEGGRTLLNRPWAAGGQSGS